jgi:hypothetical protein
MRWSSELSKLLTRAVGVVVAGCFAQAALAQSEPEFMDLQRYSMETPAIKSILSQGIMSAAAPGRLEPGSTIKRGDLLSPCSASSICRNQIKPGNSRTSIQPMLFTLPWKQLRPTWIRRCRAPTASSHQISPQVKGYRAHSRQLQWSGFWLTERNCSC